MLNTIILVPKPSENQTLLNHLPYVPHSKYLLLELNEQMYKKLASGIQEAYNMNNKSLRSIGSILLKKDESNLGIGSGQIFWKTYKYLQLEIYADLKKSKAWDEALRK